MLQQIDITDLKPGMFVNRILEQSGQLKMKTKGLVSSDKSIEALVAKGVLRLEIDTTRGDAVKEDTPEKVPSKNAEAEVEKAEVLSDSEQIEAATKLYDDALVIQSRFFKRMAAKDAVSLDNVKQLSSKFIDSVMVMPNGMSCLSLLNKTGKYLLEHSLNCSILLTMFAKSKNMSKEEIESLSLAGLLMDVGMTNMPDEITKSPKKLTASQHEMMTTHVDIGLDLVEKCGDISDIVRDIIFNHHERIDGSGYPDAQSKEDVSIYTRMAAIVDSYDAMTSARLFRKPITPSRALSRLLKDSAYDQTLVAQFIQCVGVHPVGSLVKLSNDRLAIVVRGNEQSPLQPHVATFYHIKTANYSEVKKVDLSKSNIKIDGSVRPEEFGLNLTKFFRDVFLNSL